MEKQEKLWHALGITSAILGIVLTIIGIVLTQVLPNKPGATGAGVALTVVGGVLVILVMVYTCMSLKNNYKLFACYSLGERHKPTDLRTRIMNDTDPVPENLTALAQLSSVTSQGNTIRYPRPAGPAAAETNAADDESQAALVYRPSPIDATVKKEVAFTPSTFSESVYSEMPNEEEIASEANGPASRRSSSTPSLTPSQKSELQFQRDFVTQSTSGEDTGEGVFQPETDPDDGTLQLVEDPDDGTLQLGGDPDDRTLPLVRDPDDRTLQLVRDPDDRTLPFAHYSGETGSEHDPRFDIELQRMSNPGPEEPGDMVEDPVYDPISSGPEPTLERPRNAEHDSTVERSIISEPTLNLERSIGSEQNSLLERPISSESNSILGRPVSSEHNSILERPSSLIIPPGEDGALNNTGDNNAEEAYIKKKIFKMRGIGLLRRKNKNKESTSHTYENSPRSSRQRHGKQYGDQEDAEVGSSFRYDSVSEIGEVDVPQSKYKLPELPEDYEPSGPSSDLMF